MVNNFALIAPEFLITGLAFIILSVDFFIRSDRQHFMAYIACAGLIGILIFSLFSLWNVEDNLYNGLLVIDSYSLVFKSFFLILGGFIILSSVEYVKRHLEHPGEYYGIVVFTILAMMLMAMSGELLTAYIALELLSFGLYVLVNLDRYNAKSNEAGTKYILLGALSSALLLYGISQIFGLLGTTRFNEIHYILSATNELSPGVLVGLILIISGLGFKVAAVPFHMWAPDTYEGAPTPITAYLAIGSKAAAFALILRFFTEALMPAVDDWQPIIIIIATLTMVVGNLVALVQKNIKRLLAYSSIGHVGYLMLGVASMASVNSEGVISLDKSHLASNAIMFHLMAYGITNLAAFLSVITIYNSTGKENISSFAGMAKRAPFLSMVFAVSLFSLAGLPIFAGFTSKFYLFTAASAQGLLWLAGVAIFASLLSMYYYLIVIRQLYIEAPSDETPIRVPKLTLALLSTLLLGIVWLGIYPAPLINMLQHASDAILTLNPVSQLTMSLDYATFR